MSQWIGENHRISTQPLDQAFRDMRAIMAKVKPYGGLPAFLDGMDLLKSQHRMWAVQHRNEGEDRVTEVSPSAEFDAYLDKWAQIALQVAE